MRLGEFLEKFSHNNLIRLHYRDGGGYICVAETFDELSMDWEVNDGKGRFAKYKDNEVIKLVGISVGRHSDVINIVIEKNDDI